MTDRRNLIEGLKATPRVDPEVAREFIHGQRQIVAPPLAQDVPAGNVAPQVRQIRTTTVRAALHTRIREDFAKALKRASLERQIEGVEPNTLQDILEEAVEPWLKAHGYITP